MCFPEKRKPPNPIKKNATYTPPCHRLGMVGGCLVFSKENSAWRGEWVKEKKTVCMLFPTFFNEVKDFSCFHDMKKPSDRKENWYTNLTVISSSLIEYLLKVSNAPSNNKLVTISLNRATTCMYRSNVKCHAVR